MARYLTEFLGTMLLVVVIACAVTQAGALAPLVVGLGLTALVYMGGHVSGAQYNPAVAIVAASLGRMPARDLVLYIAAQLAGAAAGAVLGAYLCGSALVITPAPGVDVLRAAAAEVVFTFALLLVILNVALHEKTKGNAFYGAAIGLVVAAGAFCVGGVSGAAFNPAVGIVPALVAGELTVTNLLLYSLAPTAGGLIAAQVFRLQQKVA